uniref:Uncharacterized protein AlNc14C153G7584 n=1 Tax=Albugo laibachii Nc14 TaxID=890382 RepID=F0WM80_9STRA|nr:conserved hypothetical protein [Albugo laibachii Nc14]|eukprot:CCA22409.1 conserved hypothetical protein [Albugo laibachii Nc14]
MEKSRGKHGAISLTRFMNGKRCERRKDATESKEKMIRKCQWKRTREKIEKKKSDQQSSNGPMSFYDEFFSNLTNKPSEPQRKKPLANNRPDPLYKAKRKAEEMKSERDEAIQMKKQKHDIVQKTIQSRKKRHAMLSARTATGQPIVRNQISDILKQLQKPKEK